MQSILGSRWFQRISTPLRDHLGSHTKRVARAYSDQAVAEHRRDLGQLTAELAVLSKRSHVQATDLSALVQLSETTRAELAEARRELGGIRVQLAAIHEALAAIRAHGDRSNPRGGPRSGSTSTRT